MRTVFKLVFVLVAISLLGACASGPTFTEHKSQIPSLAPDMGRVYFYRTSAFGAALRPNVVLNGEIVGEAVAQGFFYVDRTPGEYIVMTSTEVDRKATFTLEKGMSRYIRFGISMGFFAGHVYPELVDDQVGMTEISECKFTGQIKKATNEK